MFRNERLTVLDIATRTGTAWALRVYKPAWAAKSRLLYIRYAFI